MVEIYQINSDTLEELATLKETGYLVDGQDIDDDLLDEVINSRKENE